MKHFIILSKEELHHLLYGHAVSFPSKVEPNTQIVMMSEETYADYALGNDVEYM